MVWSQTPNFQNRRGLWGKWCTLFLQLIDSLSTACVALVAQDASLAALVEQVLRFSYLQRLWSVQKKEVRPSAQAAWPLSQGIFSRNSARTNRTLRSFKLEAWYLLWITSWRGLYRNLLNHEKLIGPRGSPNRPKPARGVLSRESIRNFGMRLS